MNSWDYIADFAKSIITTAKNETSYIDYKQKKDGIIISNELWQDFVAEQNNSLSHAQKFMDVTVNSKGVFDCNMQFPKGHIEEGQNGLSYEQYVVKNCDNGFKARYNGINNKHARELLNNHYTHYRLNLSNHLNDYVVKMVVGKREDLAIQSIDKYAKLTYNNHLSYSDNLSNVATNFSLVGMSPTQKEKYFEMSREKLSYAAAASFIKQSPGVFLSKEFQPSWKKDLNFKHFIKLTNEAKSSILLRNTEQKKTTKAMLPSHFDSLRETGTGIAGLDQLVKNAWGEKSLDYSLFKQKEATIKEAFQVNSVVTESSLVDGRAAIEAVKPPSGDVNYHEKHKVYEELLGEYEKQKGLLERDPAEYVDKYHRDKFPEGASLPQKMTIRKKIQEDKGLPLHMRKALPERELEVFSKGFEVESPNELKKNVDNVLSLEQGGEVFKEALGQKTEDKKLNHLVSGYIAARMTGNDKLADTFIKIIPLRKQLYSSISETDKKKTNEAVEKGLKDWTLAMLTEGAHFVSDVSDVKHQVMDVARYHEIEHGKTGFFGGLSPASVSDSVRGSIALIIGAQQQKVYPTLYVPKKIKTEDKIVHIDSGKMKNGLDLIKKQLVGGAIPYNKAVTFGNTKGHEDAISKCLADGVWRLFPDYQHVVFSVPTTSGEWFPVMASAREPLLFSIADIGGVE